MVAVVHTESLIQQHQGEREDQLNPQTVVLAVPSYIKMNGSTNNLTTTALEHMNGNSALGGESESDEEMRIDIKVEMDDDDNKSVESGIVDGEVVIYEFGKPILKVESGTTLEVVKLLYETESDKENNIIGVRPKLADSDIPCIITLKDSKLEENSYDLITKDKRPSPRPSPVNINGNGVSSSQESSTMMMMMKNGSSPPTSTTTARCIECSRESWKTKRYTNVGMNTEISINPSMDGESVRSITGAGAGSGPTKQATKAVSTNDAPPPRRGRPPIQRQPNYSAMHPKEFVVAPIPTMPVPTVSEMEYRHYSRRSPRDSPVHMFGHTKIYPPSMEQRGVDLDSVPYEPLRTMHHPPPPLPPHHHSRRPSPPRHMVKMEAERRSPPRRQHNRSPILYQNGYLKEEPREFYRHLPLKGEEAKRRHRYYPYEVPPPPAVMMPAPPPQRPVERPSPPLPTPVSREPEPEPTVYVLPEGFDLETDGFDPTFIGAQQQPQAGQQSPRDVQKENKENKEMKHSPILPRSPVTMASPKASPTEEQKAHQQQQPSQNASPPTHQQNGVVVNKLSCKICKQTFPTKSTLYKHLRGHSSDEKPFKCNECGQGFTLSSNLRQHRIIHRGYKPFQCEYCGKKFMRSNVYKQHRRIHTGEQMHKCDLCPSEFLQKYALVKHLKKVHNIETYDN